MSGGIGIFFEFIDMLLQLVTTMNKFIFFYFIHFAQTNILSGNIVAGQQFVSLTFTRRITVNSIQYVQSVNENTTSVSQVTFIARNKSKRAKYFMGHALQRKYN